jgi:tRNA(adenine34) deaminase
MDTDRYFMQMALREAEAAYEAGEVPVGAVIVLHGRLIGRGHNQVEQLGDPTAHAEMIAITAAAEQFESWRLLDAELFCTLEPCAMCAGALVLARVSRVVFGARDPKFGACGSIFNIPTDGRLNHRVEITEGILAEEVSALMREFFAQRRKKESRDD